MPSSSVVLADAGFGTFAVAHATAQAGHVFLFRLTRQRFTALLRQARLTAGGQGFQTWSLTCNLKVVLDTEHIRARSLDTFHKELLASVISYNPVTQFRRQAAQLARVSPRQLRFKWVWTTSRQFLLPRSHTDPALWR